MPSRGFCTPSLRVMPKIQDSHYFFVIRIFIPTDPAHHEAACRQLRPRRRSLQARFIVLRQMPAARHPGEGSLHDTAALQNRGPHDVLGFVDDFKDGSDPEILERGRQLRSLISAVRPELRGMRRRLQHAEDCGWSPSRSCTEASRTVIVIGKVVCRWLVFDRKSSNL